MIIAIDGASTDLSVALATVDGEPIGQDAWSTAMRQSAELLPHLLALLASSRRGLDEASALAVGSGPGSFTGLRVAMALAKGLAMALDRPIVAVPSLVAWLEAEPQAAAAVARAGAREAYVLLRGESEPRILDREALPEAIGTTPVVAAEEVAAAFGLGAARSPAAAGAIARLAAVRLATEPAGDDLRRLEPIYLRAPRGLSVDAGAEVKWL